MHTNQQKKIFTALSNVTTKVVNKIITAIVQLSYP